MTRWVGTKGRGLPAPQREVWATGRGDVEGASFGEGPEVLCLHGALGGYDQGLLLARVLGEEGFRYLAPSRPGYLGTPLDRGRTPEEQADLYAALLDAMGVERAAVMAVSGGGASAIHFALRHWDRCRGLVLVSVPAQAVRRPPRSFAVLKLLVRVPGVEALLRRRALRRPEEAARRSLADPELRERILGDPEAWALLQELQRSTLDRMRLRLAGTDNDAEVAATRAYPLEELRVPVLALLGTRDPWIPFEVHARAFSLRVPEVELVPLGGDHGAIFSHRREARDRVHRFLRRVAGPSSGA